MASVYHAQDLKLRRMVAIKILHAEHKASDAFQREAQTAAGIAHPNVVTIYDVGQDGDVDYIVMEYVRGRTLQDLIREQAPLRIGQAVDIVLQICDAVEFIHAQGIVHCDLKPQNVLILDDRQVKITDFGIARDLSMASPAQRVRVWGTPYYASPELITGKPITPASDVYAIGLIFYEMLAGARPFEGQNAADIARQHALNAPPPLSARHPRVPRYICQIIDRTLAKDPANRYRTADQVRQLLASYKGRSQSITQPLSPLPKAAASAPVRQAAAAPAKPRPAPSRGFDWLLLILVALAVLAVTGLVPLWGTIISRAFAQPATPVPTVPSQGMATPTPTTTAGPGEATSVPVLPTATELLVPVPNLVGKTVDEARQLAQEGELFLTVLEEQHSMEGDAGVILAQDPAADSQVAPGTEIQVVASLGPPIVTMPKAVGFPISIKQLDLQELGLTIFVTETWSIEPAGLVIEQQPEPGTEIQAGSTVTLTVSSGIQGEVQANLDYKLVLVAFELDKDVFRPGDVVQLDFTWQVLEQMSRSYTLFIHVTREDGSIVTQLDAPPLGGSRPTNTWQRDEILHDVQVLTLPTSLPRGRYAIRVGMYDGTYRMPVVDAGTASVQDNALIVARIQVE